MLGSLFFTIFVAYSIKIITFPHFSISLFLSHGRRYQDWYRHHKEGEESFNEKMCVEIESLEDLILSFRRGEGDTLCSFTSMDNQIAVCMNRIAFLERELINAPYSLPL